VLNSVYQYLAYTVLTGIESRYLDPVIASAALPPVFTDVVANPYAFVWSATSDEHQQTGPRTMGPRGGTIQPGGYQKMVWEIQIDLAAVISQDTPNAQQAFPACFDQVIRALNTCTIPVIITDPATTQKSQILTIGVNLHTDIASAYSTSTTSQGLMRFGASIVCEVQEKVDWSGGVPT